MKKTKTIFFALLLIILLLVSSCNNSILADGDSSIKHGLQEKQTYNIFDFTFYLNDVEYILPLPLEEFIQNGWKIKDGFFYPSLEKDETKYIELEKNSSTISVIIVNEKKHNIDTIESTVVSVTYDVKNNDEGENVFKLFDEVFTGINFFEIENSLGKPSKIKQLDYIYIAEYYLTRLSSTELYFNKENDLLEKIVITNNQELFTYSKENLKIKKFKNPSTLSALPLSNDIELYGDIFTLPIKISDLIYCGWVAKSDVLSKINSKENKSVILTRNNISMEVISINNSDTEKNVLECEVNSLEYNKILSYGEKPFKLPMDITEISTQSDIIEKYGTPQKQSDNYIEYFSEENNIQIIFIFDKNGIMQVMSFTKKTI